MKAVILIPYYRQMIQVLHLHRKSTEKRLAGWHLDYMHQRSFTGGRKNDADVFAADVKEPIRIEIKMLY